MLASGIALGIAAGWLFGGRLGRLADVRIAWWPLLAVAVALRLAAPSVGESLIIWSLSFAVIALVALLNRGLPGMWLIALGASMNLLVVLLNAAMPVDTSAARTAGVEIPVGGLHRELRATDVLSALADRIPVPFISRVYSVGDVLLAVGGFWLPFTWMRRRRPL